MEFYAFWNANQIRGLFEAIVFIVGGSDFLGLLRAVAVVGALTITTTAILSQRHTDHAMYYFALAIFYTTLIVPRTDVIIRDVRTGAAYVVANVPLGVALPASTASHVGYWLTDLFETAFVPVDDIGKFSRFGMAYPQRIITALQSVGAVTPAGREMLNRFTKDCLVPEMIESPAKANQVMYSANIWNTIDAPGWVNPARLTLDSGGNPVDCPTALDSVFIQINTIEIPALQAKLAKMLVPGHLNPSTLVLANIPQAETLLLGMSRSFEESLRQSIMIDAVPTGISLAGASGAPLATAVGLAASQANLTSTINYRAMAEIAKEALPKLRSAIEFLVIASFPFMLLMTVASGHKAGTVLRGFIIMLLWVQLWPPLYAAINYLVIVADAAPMTQLIIAEGGNSIASMDLIRQFGASAQDIAGMLTLSVPVIAYALAKGGEVATTAMISSVMSPATGAAQSVGGQLAAGNVSFGSVSWGTTNTNSANANSMDRSMRATSSAGATMSDAYGTASYAGDGGTPILRSNSTTLGAVSSSRSASADISNSSRSSSGADASLTQAVGALRSERASVDDVLRSEKGRQAQDAAQRIAGIDSGLSGSGSATTAVNTSNGARGVENEALAGRFSIGARGGVAARGSTGDTSVGPGSSTVPGSPVDQPQVAASNPGAASNPAGTTSPSSPRVNAPATVKSPSSRRPAFGMDFGLSGGADSSNTSTRMAETTSGTNRESAAQGRYGSEIRAYNQVASNHHDAGVRLAARALAAGYTKMASLEERMEGALRNSLSASDDRSSGSTATDRVSLSKEPQVAQRLLNQGNTPGEILKMGSTGDPRLVAAAAPDSTQNGGLSSFAGSNLQAPISQSTVASTSGGYRDAARSQGTNDVTANRREGNASVAAFQPFSYDSSPDTSAIDQSVAGAQSGLSDQFSQARTAAMGGAGITYVGALMTASGFAGSGGVNQLIGQAIGLNALAGKSPEGISQVQQHMGQIMQRQIEFPDAAAAIQQIGSKFSSNQEITPDDVKKLDQAVTPAIIAIRTGGISFPSNAGALEQALPPKR